MRSPAFQPEEPAAAGVAAAEGEQQEEQLVQAWEGPMEQAAASLLGARLKVCMCSPPSASDTSIAQATSITHTTLRSHRMPLMPQNRRPRPPQPARRRRRPRLIWTSWRKAASTAPATRPTGATASRPRRT